MLDVYSAPSGNVEMIISVLNGQGTPINGLTKANFKLDVEGKKIKEFSLEPISSAKNPLSIILGMDVSGSMKGNPIKEAKFDKAPPQALHAYHTNNSLWPGF